MSYGALASWCYADAMFGRVLLAVIALVITAGLALPLLPGRVEAPGHVALHAVESAAETVTARCGDCRLANGTSPICPSSACRCGYVLTAAWAGPEASISIMLELLVWPLPGGLPSQPQPLPPKAPAI